MDSLLMIHSAAGGHFGPGISRHPRSRRRPARAAPARRIHNYKRTINPDRMPQLSDAYDRAMTSRSAEHKIGSTTTRLYDFVNRGAEFDPLYIHPPLLEACSEIIGSPFKLSATLGRTLRPGTRAQDLHVDIPRDSPDVPMASFIYMVDEFRPDNGATRFISGSHRWASVPEDAIGDRKLSLQGEMLACAPAGSMIIFNASIWHGHTANRTGHPRRSVQGYFIRREVRAEFDNTSRITPETLARISHRARYVLGFGEESALTLLECSGGVREETRTSARVGLLDLFTGVGRGAGS